MTKWKRIVVIVVIAILAVGGYYGYRQYTAGPENISNAKAISITATTLLTDYTNAEAEANKKYIGKILAVSGSVKEVSKNQEGQTVVILKTDDPINSINCTLEQQGTDIKPGDNVTLKGLCTGYMMDVYITRCYLLK